MFLEICICILMIMLFGVQFMLASKQLKLKTPDSKILLTIDIAAVVIWIPLAALMFITNIIGIKIAWYIVSVIYMCFTMWYNNMLKRR